MQLNLGPEMEEDARSNPCSQSQNAHRAIWKQRRQRRKDVIVGICYHFVRIVHTLDIARPVQQKQTAASQGMVRSSRNLQNLHKIVPKKASTRGILYSEGLHKKMRQTLGIRMRLNL